MRVCGIIAEYDPFHRGHRHHIEEARRLSQADFIVCVISGAFTQRGLAGMFSTHDRARMALENGADVVLGMPVASSCAQANRFALGGVGILHQLGAITHVSFGVEAEGLSLISAAAGLLDEDGAELSATRRAALQSGKSFARAQGEALSRLLPQAAPSTLARPNFVLGLSYLRALHALGSDIIPCPVTRSTDYHDTKLVPLPSASAVRLAVLRGDWQGLAASLPHESLSIVRAAVYEGRIHHPGALDSVLLHVLLRGNASHGTAEISEGLEQRITAKARLATNRAELIDMVKSKRYPYTRISRALSSILLGLADLPPSAPEYARLLGFRRRAAPLLRAFKTNAFPLIDRPARSQHPGIRADMRAEELWCLGAHLPASLAYRQKTIILP